MSDPNIDASISAPDMQAIKGAFATIKEKLNSLVTLTAEERQANGKGAPDRVSFVRNALMAAEVTPEIFPAHFSTPGFQKDVDLFAILTELGTLAASVASQIDHTRLAVGKKSMRQATQVYNYVKEAAKTTPGLKPLADHLGEQFQKVSAVKEPSKRTARAAVSVP